MNFNAYPNLKSDMPNTLKNVIKHPCAILLLISIAAGAVIQIYNLINTITSFSYSQEILGSQYSEDVIAIARGFSISISSFNAVIHLIPFIALLIMIIQARTSENVKSFNVGLMLNKTYAIILLSIMTLITLLFCAVGVILMALPTMDSYYYDDYSYSSIIGFVLFLCILFLLIHIFWCINAIMLFSSAKKNQLNPLSPLKGLKGMKVFSILCAIIWILIFVDRMFTTVTPYGPVISANNESSTSVIVSIIVQFSYALNYILIAVLLSVYKKEISKTYMIAAEKLQSNNVNTTYGAANNIPDRGYFPNANANPQYRPPEYRQPPVINSPYQNNYTPNYPAPYNIKSPEITDNIENQTTTEQNTYSQDKDINTQNQDVSTGFAPIDDYTDDNNQYR